MSEGCPVCQGSGVIGPMTSAVPCERCACPECGHPLAMHVLGYGCGVEGAEGAGLLNLCKCEKYQ